MSEKEDSGKLERLADVDRRKFLAGVGAGMSALAGCGGGGQPETRTVVKTKVKEETVVKTKVKEETVVKTKKVTQSPTPTETVPKGESDALLFNPMGYTGADDLIKKQATMMDQEARKPIVKQVLAKMYSDAPTEISWHSNVLQPTTKDWTGWVQTVGGVLSTDTFLNVRPAGGGSGGKPIQGMATPPDTLNPLATSTAYSFEILDKIYTYGTTLHPDTLAFEPWGFKDWTLTPENVGTDKPTLVGELRDDLTFNDGEPVTAEDYQFTVDYIVSQETAGSIAASQFSALEGFKDKKVAGNGVTVDSPDGTTVNFFFKEKDRAWFTNVLGNIILPKHIWKDVSDYKKYNPRKSSEGLVGSGPMELTDFKWEAWFELDWRGDDAIWQPGAEYATWIDDDAPFTDGWRIEVFGSENAKFQALLNGDIDVAYGSMPVDKAVQAEKKDFLKVWQSDDDGWHHHSWNTRRVPFDDPAFRQLLVKMVDDDWMVNELFKGVGAVKGTYATPKAYGEWRPPEPEGALAGGTYEGIPIPDLSFPGEKGSFQVSSKAVTKARNFLKNHGRAKHDYSFDKAVTDITTAPDGKELYVNGKPLTEAHTNNVGEGGQGPLEMSFNPPQESVQEARYAQRWVSALKEIGIPVTTQVQSFNSQIPKIYGQENFDMFAMGWTGIGVNNDHYKQLFGKWGADLGYQS